MDIMEMLLKARPQTALELEEQQKNIHWHEAYEQRYGVSAGEDPLYKGRHEDFKVYYATL